MGAKWQVGGIRLGFGSVQAASGVKLWYSCLWWLLAACFPVLRLQTLNPKPPTLGANTGLLHWEELNVVPSRIAQPYAGIGNSEAVKPCKL